MEYASEMSTARGRPADESNEGRNRGKQSKTQDGRTLRDGDDDDGDTDNESAEQVEQSAGLETGGGDFEAELSVGVDRRAVSAPIRRGFRGIRVQAI